MKKTDSNNIIYHYIQKVLLNNDETNELAKELIARLITDLSIWISPEIYKELPVFAPYIVRDATCRRKNPLTNKHEWGCADKDGYFRDDNSMIKSFVKPLKFQSNAHQLYKGQPGKGLVACHIWRTLRNQKVLASKFPPTNSFIPNLVWLPAQISQLTDRESSYAQQFIQLISYKLYRHYDCDINVDDIWGELELPSITIPSCVNINNLNLFVPKDEKIIRNRRDGLSAEIKHIVNALDGQPIPKKIKSSSYTDSLPQAILKMSQKQKEDMRAWLSRFV